MMNDNLSPIDWAKRPLQKYADFSGRAPRSELWWFILFILIAAIVSTIVDDLLGLKVVGPYGVLTLVLMLGVLVPNIAVQVRRLHDTDRSGWWVAIFYGIYAAFLAMVAPAMMAMQSAADSSTPVSPAIPAMGAGAGLLGLVMLIYCVVLIVFYCQRGTAGDNRYGPDPQTTPIAPQRTVV